MSDQYVSKIPRNVGTGDQVVPEDETFNTPDGDEVYRIDEERGIKVDVVSTVPVEVASSPVTGFRTFSLSTTQGQRILDTDPRRKCATIIPIDTDIRMGGDKSSSESTGGTRLPMAVPLLLTSCDEVWATAVNIACEVSVFYELWAR